MIYSQGYKKSNMKSRLNKYDVRCWMCCNYSKGLCTKFDITLIDKRKATTCNSYNKRMDKKNNQVNNNLIIKNSKYKDITLSVRAGILKDFAYYIGVLEYNNVKKTLYKIFEPNETLKVNRLIVRGCIEGVLMLKEPCNIHLKLSTVTGINNLNYNGVNKDINNVFNDLITSKNHYLNISVTSDNQKELLKAIKEIYKENYV